jgi:hypothetical protein
MTTIDDVQKTEARHQIALAAGVALLVAGLVLVMFVLPAEYAVDPLGVGARTGLLDLGVTGQQVEALNSTAPTAAGQAAIIVPQEHRFQQETVTFTLGPNEGMEYKYRLDKGQALLFAWTASVPVSYEAHAEPDGAPRGYAQSYEKGSGRANASGTLTAPFPGIHGWFWENPTDQPITVTLSTSGYYTLSHEFRTGAPTKNKTFQ